MGVWGGGVCVSCHFYVIAAGRGILVIPCPLPLQENQRPVADPERRCLPAPLAGWLLLVIFFSSLSLLFYSSVLLLSYWWSSLSLLMDTLFHALWERRHVFFLFHQVVQETIQIWPWMRSEVLGCILQAKKFLLFSFLVLFWCSHSGCVFLMFNFFVPKKLARKSQHTQVKVSLLPTFVFCWVRALFVCYDSVTAAWFRHDLVTTINLCLATLSQTRSISLTWNDNHCIVGHACFF